MHGNYDLTFSYPPKACVKLRANSATENPIIVQLLTIGATTFQPNVRERW